MVRTPWKTLISDQGTNVILPCWYYYRPPLVSPRPVTVKWQKLLGNRAVNVLVARGPRQRSFGDYRGRVHLRPNYDEHKVSLEIQDLRLKDFGRYRCKVIDGLERKSSLVNLELRGEALSGAG